MKGFIILAVTSFLVGVQASSISRVQKELDIDESKTVESTWLLEELDGTSANGALDEMPKIEAIVDVLHFLRNYKDVMGCSSSTCEWCISPACFKISYLPNRKEFEICATYNSNNVFCQSVPVRSFKSCKTIKVNNQNVELCIEAMNVIINGGRVCMDVKVSAAGISNNFRNICLGPPVHFNIASLNTFDKQLRI